MPALDRDAQVQDEDVDAMLAARRFGGDAAASGGIVAGAVTEDEVLPAAVALAADQAAKDGGTLAEIKRRMYASALGALADRDANRLGAA